MKNFVLIGVAGYIAPKHLEAIKQTGNMLLAAIDKHDAVGILDHYFPDCNFFTEFERFDRHCEKLKRQGTKIDYVVVCSPNYLHDAHIRFGLKLGADVICEKPVVINPWNIDGLLEIEKETQKKVFSILQLRLHPEIVQLKAAIEANKSPEKHQVNLQYITARGNWYHNSWKGDSSKSGGIVTNIGIHFFDMLLWIFGPVQQHQVSSSSPTSAKGTIELEHATIQWMLSIDAKDLPEAQKNNGKQVSRNLKVNDIEIDFTEGFTDLHTKSYAAILAGNGFTLEDARASISFAHDCRMQAQELK